MSVYNLNGQMITSVCHTNGQALNQVYDLRGNGILVDVSDAPIFYQHDIEDAVAYLRGLGTDYANYAVVNDQHYTAYNYNHTPQIMKSLHKAGVIDKFLFLGDLIDSGETTLAATWKTHYADIIPHSFVILGNHELFNVQANDIYTWWKENVFDVMAAPTSWGATDHSYYYYDNTEHHFRLIFCDPNHDSSNQKTWLYNTINSVPDGWSFFVMTHEAPFVYEPVGYPTYSTFRDTNLFGTFETDMASNAKLGAIFCGHHHNDVYQVNSGLQQIAFLTDSYVTAGSTNEGCPMPERSHKDNTAQSITIISINAAQRKVKLLRIGQFDNACGFGWDNNKRKEINY